MARRSVRLLASIAAVATMATTFAACGNKQATTDENGKPIVNILVRRNVTDHPMQDTQYTKDLEAACDCTIKWQEVSDNAWGQQKSAKMAAGEFPDIGLSLFSMVDAAKTAPISRISSRIWTRCRTSRSSSRPSRAPRST